MFFLHNHLRFNILYNRDGSTGEQQAAVLCRCEVMSAACGVMEEDQWRGVARAQQPCSATADLYHALVG